MFRKRNRKNLEVKHEKNMKYKGEYTYSIQDSKADNEEQAKVIAQDDEPLCTWDNIEQDSYLKICRKCNNRG